MFCPAISHNLHKCLTNSFFEALKKLAQLLLLIPVFLQAGGMMLICLLLQNSVKQNAQDLLLSHDSKFEKLILTADQYRLSKINEKELRFEGQLFDIKSISFHGRLVEVIAYNDRKEEGLISSIDNFFGNSSQNKKKIPVQVLKLLVSLYTIPKNVVKFSQDFSSSSYRLTIPAFYHSFKNDVFSPPPELIA